MYNIGVQYLFLICKSTVIDFCYLANACDSVSWMALCVFIRFSMIVADIQFKRTEIGQVTSFYLVSVAPF